MANRHDITLYYDNRIEASIGDYFTGNKRLTEALEFTIRNIPASCKNILDLGCGIGWTSYEFAKHFAKSQVTGFDISDKSIEFAKSFFFHKNLSFEKGDIRRLPDYIQKKFEVITLIDVFEHIEKSERHNFYQLINEIIADHGKVLMTCPSVYHQNFLRKFKPNELQPVDEDVLLIDILQFTSSIGAEITYFNYKSIWRKHDYIHIILDKNPGKYEEFSKKSVQLNIKLDRQFDKYLKFNRYRGSIYSETINRYKKYWLLRYLKNCLKINNH